MRFRQQIYILRQTWREYFGIVDKLTERTRKHITATTILWIIYFLRFFHSKFPFNWQNIIKNWREVTIISGDIVILLLIFGVTWFWNFSALFPRNTFKNNTSDKELTAYIYLQTLHHLLSQFCICISLYAKLFFVYTQRFLSRNALPKNYNCSDIPT